MKFSPSKKQKTLSILFKTYLLLSFFLLCFQPIKAQVLDSIQIEDVTFESEGVVLSGSILKPKKAFAAVVIVHGSDPVKREMEFAKRLAKEGITVLTYDKRGVGASGGVYAGPEVGTNNIAIDNLTLLAKDANAAVSKLRQLEKNTPIGLVGFSQAG